VAASHSIDAVLSLEPGGEGFLNIFKIPPNF